MSYGSVFYTTHAWFNASELEIGAAILNLSGAYGTVAAVQTITDPQPMYNLTVAEAHTFFVGEGEWLVHNTDGCNGKHPQNRTSQK